MSHGKLAPLDRIDSELELKIALSSLGYQSVFDVVKISKKNFVKRHRGDLGVNCAKAYDLAVGFASQVSRQYKNLERKPKVKSNTRSLSRVNGLEKDGPTYQILFEDDWSSYCLNGAPEANDSPASYLSYLYNQALSFESEMVASGGSGIITLQKRRPDLATLVIDNQAINQVVPALTVVNQILEDIVQPYANSAANGQSVDEALSGTRYPNLLPYHFPHEQATLSLKANNESLMDVIQQCDNSWPYFPKNPFGVGAAETALQLGSNLAPEEQKIITETPVEESDISDFYLANFGVAAPSYGDFDQLQVFTAQTGLTVHQVEQLISGTVGGCSVIASPNCTNGQATPGDYGSVYINGGDAAGDIFLLDSSVPGFDMLGNAPLVISGNPDINNESGKFGASIIIDSRNGESMSMPFEGNLSGDTGAFTLGFWCKFRAVAVDNTSIASIGSPWKTPSVGATVDTTNGLVVEIEAWGVKGDVNGNAWTTGVENRGGDWVYVYIARDYSGDYVNGGAGAVGKIEYLDIDCSELTSYDASDSACYFNNDASRKGSIEYNDITIWNRLLTHDEFNELVLSSLPAAETVPTGVIRNFVFGQYAALSNLSDERMDRINRMVRLQRWIDLPYNEADLLVTSAMRAEGSANISLETNPNTLRTLGTYRYFNENFNVTAEQFSAVIWQITPYAITPNVPFFDQIFNSPSLFEDPFKITDADFDYTVATGADARIVKQICAGLDINESQFRILANQIADQRGSSGAKTLSCSLDVVSAFYRLVMIPRWLGLTFPDGLALMQLLRADGSVLSGLAGVPAISPINDAGEPTGDDVLDTLMALAAAANWLKQNALSAVTCNLLMLPDTHVTLATTAEVNFVSEINQQLPSALLSEAIFETCGVPASSALALNKDLTLFGTPDTVPGIVSSALQLDSSKTQYAVLLGGANGLMDGARSYTIGMWVNIVDYSGYYPILANSDATSAGIGNEHGVGLFYNSGTANSLCLHIGVSGVGSIQNDDNILVSGQWFYVAQVYDKDNEQFIIYCGDSSSDASVTHGTLSLTGKYVNFPNNYPWTFNENGELNFSDKEAANKLIIQLDDVSIWDGILDESAIQNIFASRRPANETILAAWQMGPSWMATLADLVSSNGLVKPIEATEGQTLWETIRQKIDDDIAGIVFDSPMSTEDISKILTGVIYQAKTTQDGIADSSIAKALKTNQSLSPFLLEWGNSSAFDLLNQTLALSEATTAADIPPAYSQLLFRLAQRAAVAGKFQLSPAMLDAFLTHPDRFGAKTTDVDLSLLYTFSRYADLLRLTPENEDAVLAYLNWASQYTSADTTATQAAAPQAATLLAALLGWNSGEVQLAAQHANPTLKIAQTLAQIDTVMRLQSLSRTTDASVSALLATGALTTSSTYADWQSVGESLIAAQSN